MTRHAWGADLDEDREYADPDPRRHDVPQWTQTLAALDGDAGVAIYARAELDGCCALDPGHEGPCAHVCPECRGSQKCWACNGHDPGDDLGSGCTECDGWGRCTYCYEGMVDDA